MVVSYESIVSRFKNYLRCFVEESCKATLAFIVYREIKQITFETFDFLQDKLCSSWCYLSHVFCNLNIDKSLDAKVIKNDKTRIRGFLLVFDIAN